MTNKQIIVGGVDVSGCDFLAKEDDYCSYSGEYRAYKGQCGCSDEEMCKDNPNCFYKKALKQLKCKEQECEELQNKFLELIGKAYSNSLELVQLKAQLLDQEAETLKAGGIIHILEKTLTEIKEVAERGFQHSQCNCGAKADLDLILQKICEVISE